MTPEALAAIAARNAARTQGKWTQHLVDDTTVVCNGQTICCTFPEGGLNDDVDFNSDTEQHEKDAAFIAHASEDIPSLLAEVARLTASLAEAEKRGYDDAKEQAANRVKDFAPANQDSWRMAELCREIATAIRAMVKP